MANVGDKFIIEIGAVQNGVNFINGLKYLVMSDEDLDKLEKYEPTHVAGPADGHDLPEFIYGMSSKDKQIHLGRVTWQ